MNIRFLPFTRLVGLLVPLAGLLALTGCQSAHSEAAKPAEQNSQAALDIVSIHVAKPIWRKVQRTVQGQGALFAKESVQLSNKLPGYVSKVLVDFGDRVRVGQLLVEIEREELELQVDTANSALKQAQANYMRAKSEHERVQQLFAEELVPPQRRDTTETEHKVAEAVVHSAEKALALAQKRLKDIRIVSPINGFVQQRFTNPGEYMDRGSKLLELVDVHPLKLRTPISERYVRFAKVGLPMRIEVDALPGETFTGRLTRIAAGVDHASRSLLVEAEIPNTDSKLRPGYFAHVTAVMGEEAALLIPRSGLYRYAGVDRIFVVNGNTITSREVKAGVEDGEMVEITEGLTEHEQVAVSALDRLADGMTVRTQLVEAR